MTSVPITSASAASRSPAAETTQPPASASPATVRPRWRWASAKTRSLIRSQAALTAPPVT